MHIVALKYLNCFVRCVKIIYYSAYMRELLSAESVILG